MEKFPETSAYGEDGNEDEIKVALIGRPNVGKSSIFNTLVGEERSIVSDVAGTTRDAIDTPVIREGQKFLFIDTAGMRRKARIDEPIEKYSIIRSLRAVDRFRCRFNGYRCYRRCYGTGQKNCRICA